MKQWEIQIGRAWNSNAIVRAIESVFESHGLERKLKCELRSYSGSTHWHFKKHRESGTIEVTIWPKQRRVWCGVQSGRTAQCIVRDLPAIIDDLRRALGKEH